MTVAVEFVVKAAQYIVPFTRVAVPVRDVSYNIPLDPVVKVPYVKRVLGELSSGSAE